MRFRLAAVCAAMMLTGCTEDRPVGWYRTAGGVPTPEQLSVEQTICQGEVQKATLASSEKGFSVLGELAKKDAYAGCMAQRGLILREIR